MATIDSDSGRPSSGRPPHALRPSRPAVLLAMGTSVGVVSASAVGVFTPLVAGGALAVACCIAVVSYRHAGGGVVADDLAPLTGTFTGPAVVDAPRASELAGRPVSHTDAA